MYKYEYNKKFLKVPIEINENYLIRIKYVWLISSVDFNLWSHESKASFLQTCYPAVTDKTHPFPLISIWRKQTTGSKLGIENDH